MADPAQPFWTLQGFVERLDAWIELQEPDDHLRVYVTTWIFTRREDPYAGVQRQPGFDNLWYGVVPRSQHDGGLVVACSYWIFETQHVVRCDSFASLSYPA